MSNLAMHECTFLNKRAIYSCTSAHFLINEQFSHTWMHTSWLFDKSNYFNTATLKTNNEAKSNIPEGSENTRDMFIFGDGTFGDGDVSGGFNRVMICFGGCWLHNLRIPQILFFIFAFSISFCIFCPNASNGAVDWFTELVPRVFESLSIAL